jgi:aryl-alcohol dehydrogenase-like predicted oxidoreductase
VVTPENIDKVERLRAWAEQRGWSVTRLALSWLASQPVVGSVIAGATSPQQVRENAEATDSHMTPEEVSEAASLVS